jgi:Predicted membrane protein (DUF2207)
MVTAWALPAHLSTDLRARLARWASFRRYLREFASVRDAPVAGLVVWNDYLEYAVALGAARRVEHQIRALDAAPLLSPPWHGAPTGVPGMAWFGHLWRRGPRRLPRGAPMPARVR